eukprot:TRINITY_DN8159_c0_g1_i1.p1 TRINITY_DN8159_c0_g1~~TRINITY_DN8159_c0_g1_i1.p1  ORF type:complete len:114 (-),score=23.06 TRINITY_DN8159_c0_g1_i1:327-668(-)
MAALPRFPTCNFGTPPDPSKPQQQFPGVNTKYLPHEALIVYTEKLMAERKAQTCDATTVWFREHKQKKRDMEKLEASIKAYRHSRTMASPFLSQKMLSKSTSLPVIAKDPHSA